MLRPFCQALGHLPLSGESPADREGAVLRNFEMKSYKPQCPARATVVLKSPATR